jgi:oligoribonuclease
VKRRRDKPVVRSQSGANLVWLDLEMTGLDPIRDVILQAALIITDAELRPLEELCIDVWQPPQALEKMVPFVREMHTKTGLLSRVKKSKVDVTATERELMTRVTGWCPYGAVLAGNSVGQDKRFLEQHMPALAGYLSYRIIDVTSIKLLASTWYGEAAVFDKPTAGEHDALVDIRNSIDELRHYRKTLFR